MNYSNSSLIVDKLKVSYVSKGIKSIVLNGLSFEAEYGKFFAIIGPSGCGKSTLLNTIAGFIKAESGTVQLNGQIIKEPSLQIGFVSQGYALFEWLTVEDNIAFGLESQKLPNNEIKQKVDELLNIIGLTAQRDYFPAELSGGMQQRVALVRSIATNPKVLLLDEPFSALDKENRVKMHELLLHFWREQKTTVLFVTHDIEEALLLADKILMLRKHSNSINEIDVLFSRPRENSLIHSEKFLNLEEEISLFYKPSFEK